MRRRSFGILLSLLLPLFTGLSCRADDLFSGKTDYVTFEPGPTVTVVAGKPNPVELHFRVRNGYHINSNRPHSDLLIPTTIKLAPPNDVMGGKITYPPGQDLSFPFSPDEKLSVYAQEFTIKALLTTTRIASSGKFTVHGELRYQACTDNACFPPRSLPLQFNINVINRMRTLHAGHGGQSPHIRR